MSERFSTHYQYYPREPNSPTTTTHSAHNHSCPNSRSASDTHVSATCQPSFPSSVCPVQTADEAKTPFSSRLLQQTEFQMSLPQLLHAVFALGPGAVHLRRGKNLLDPCLLQGWTCCEVVREPLSPGGRHWHLPNSILDRLRTTIPESILSGQCRSGCHQHFGGVFILSRKPDSGRLLRQFPDLSLGRRIHRPPDLGGQILPRTQIEHPKSDCHHALWTTYRH